MLLEILESKGILETLRLERERKRDFLFLERDEESDAFGGVLGVE